MRKRSTARVVNGVVSAVIAAVFLAHALMGALSLAFGFSNSFAWLIWVGVALVGVHVVLSVVTSREQLSNVDRPPSPRKKRHLALKWGSGLALAVLAGLHVATRLFPDTVTDAAALMETAVLVLLSAALAAHVCIGCRSLLKDLSLNRDWKWPLRTAVLVCAGVVVAVLIGGCFSRC